MVLELSQTSRLEYCDVRVLCHFKGIMSHISVQVILQQHKYTINFSRKYTIAIFLVLVVFWNKKLLEVIGSVSFGSRQLPITHHLNPSLAKGHRLFKVELDKAGLHF